MFKTLLPKLKIAFTLLLIGIISGVSIWGTHSLTEDRIEENRERQRLEVYVEMFPNLDVTNIETEAIENNIIKQKLTFYDSSNNLLGYAMQGSESNSQGYIEAVIGVKANGDIVDVSITTTENTPSYVQDLNPYIDNFKGQSLQNVSYDANTGSTVTYNSIKKMIEASVLLVQGDPTEEAYQTIFDAYSYYELRFEFIEGLYNAEYTIYDDADNAIGYGYHADITYSDDTYTVAIVVSEDNTFLGFVSVDQNAPDTLITDLAVFDSYQDTAIEAVTLSNSEAETLAEAFTYLQDFLTESTRITDNDYLVHFENVYDESDALIGRRYIGQSEGYSGTNVVSVTLLLDGTINNITLLSSSDSEEIYGDNGMFDNPLYVEDWSDYIGTDNIDGILDDVFAGATVSGVSFKDIVSAAIEYEGSVE